METFADDASIFIKRNPEYLRECVSILKQFARISGLQCNLEKTSVIPIEGNFDTSDRLCPELALNWVSEFTLLRFQINSRVLRLIKCSLSLTSDKSDRGKYSIAAVVLWTLSLSVKME